MDNKSKIKPGMYERICVVPDDRLVIVDDYGAYLPEEDFAQFEPDLRMISYWGLDTAEMEYHTHERFNEVIDNIDFLEPLVLKVLEIKDIEEKRKTDPLYGYEGEELKEKEKEKDKEKNAEEYSNKISGYIVVNIPEGTFKSRIRRDILLNMLIFIDTARYNLSPTVTLFDSDDEPMVMSVASATRVLAEAGKALEEATDETITQDKEVDTRD